MYNEEIQGRCNNLERGGGAPLNTTNHDQSVAPKGRIVICTIEFGMGLDCADVSQVIHRRKSHLKMISEDMKQYCMNMQTNFLSRSVRG